MKDRSPSWIGIVVATSLVLVACASSTKEGAVGVHRSQFLAVSSKQMNDGAVEAYRETLQKAQAAGQLNRDPAQLQRLRAMAQRIIPHTAVFRDDAPRWAWEVNLITSDQINAWCMPGGKIAFYTAILEKLRLTDDEAAAIMGHEIAHALREHSRERASQMMVSQGVVGVLGAAVGAGQIGMQMGQMVAQVTFNLPNSRLQETEADRIGVELSARAGYDPRAAIALWQKMAQLGSSGPGWLSTHPSADDRIKDLEEYSRKVMPIYEQARRRAALDALPLAAVASAPVAAAQRTLASLLAAGGHLR